jgi:hypothetical protein
MTIDDYYEREFEPWFLAFADVYTVSMNMDTVFDKVQWKGEHRYSAGFEIEVDKNKE